MKKKLTIIITIIALVVFSFSGCVNSSTDAQDAQQSTIFSQTTTTQDTTGSSSSVESNADEDIEQIENKVSDKDLNTEYDTDNQIILSDNATQTNADGVSIDKNTVTIQNAGTYIITGTLTDGQLIVEATKVDVVHLVFDNVNISSSTGSAVYVKQAEKVVITLTEGSQNTISDAKSYEGDADAAIYAEDDLTINGTGTLTVYGNYKHAIKTVDDLVVAGGVLILEAEQECLRGKDSVTIVDGNITISAGGDGIKSDNDEEDASGWILVEGGTINIKSVLNGFDAQVSLEITGGTINITSNQDAMHSNGSIRISDGEIDIYAGDDGIHADNSLDVLGGYITVNQSYEGFEASDITIQGGVNLIKASDDGINAAGGSDGDVSPNDRFRSTGNYFISISGGYTYVYGDGDGVDSNGDIYISGGILIVDGPESGANSAMDMEMGTYSITGGTVVAAGSTQMLVTPTETTQPTFTIIFNQTQRAGTTVVIADEDVNILFAVSPKKSYQSLQITSPLLELGQTYTILYGGDISGDSLDGTYYTQGSFTNTSDSASFVLSGSNMMIDQDGNATNYSGGMGGMPGGGRTGGGGRR